MVEVSQGNPVWALGLMSGTSMDGVDAALVLTDGETVSEFGAVHSLPFHGVELGFLPYVHRRWDHYRPPQNEGLAYELAAAGATVDNLHILAAGTLLERSGGGADVVGYHGQTVAHAPDEGWTWQLGDGDVLAKALHVPVVSDFRSSDMESGGQGAPLAPFFHFTLAKRIGASGPLAFLNIGGVANVTWVDPARSAPEEDGALVAFDTGPGNALLNDWMLRRTGEAIDRDGETAARGEVDWMSLHSAPVAVFLDRKPPKSVDRNDFFPVFDAMSDLGAEDGAATLTTFTADCVVASLCHMPSPPTRWLVCGGGRRNLTLMRMLAERLDAPVDPVEAVGLDGDMLEAQAFAYLAVRVLRGLPTSAPSTTGCREPVCGGRISYP